MPVVRALVRAHKFDIVHRDLKPDNIFVTDSGQIKVLDFGIAKLFSDEKQAEATGAKLPQADLANMRNMGLTREGAILGTMPYMSPEQWGLGTVDHATDIWAVGIMMYEMLAGRHPLEPLTPKRLMQNAVLIHTPMPSIADAVPEVPGDLEAVIDSCLRKDKSQRFQNAQALLDALEPLLPARLGRTLSEEEGPYPGLVAFQESDADRFFGRSREVLRTLKRLREHALVGIVGPSGVGKSSFVRAGVVPALKASGESWESFVVRPGRDPLGALATMLQPLTRTSSTTVESLVEEHSALVDRIRREPGYVGTLLRQRARQKHSEVLLFVDQFEELYTLVPDAGIRNAFTSALAAVADDPSSPLRVIVSMRSDYLDRTGENERFLEELTRGLVFLQPPDAKGLREALTQPVEMVGYDFESSALVDDMLGTLAATPGALPLLQFTAAKLWDTRDRTRKLLTTQSYRSMGGVAGALASHADEVVASVSSQQQKIVCEIFKRLVTAEGTRAVIDVDELLQLGGDAAEQARLVDHLVQSRLLVVHKRSEAVAPAVEIVHESLITCWPTLRRWLDESHEDFAFLEQLRGAAKQWQAKDRAAGLLWRDEAMKEAKRFQGRYQGELARREQEYLDAVFALAARAGRFKRRLTAGSFVLLVCLVVAGSIALVWIREAEQEALQQADIAENEKVRSQTAEMQLGVQLEKFKKEERARLAAEEKIARAQEQAARAEGDTARAEEQAARAEELAARAKGLIARAEGDTAQAEEQAARAKEQAARAKEQAARAQEQAARAQEQAARAKKKIEAGKATIAMTYEQLQVALRQARVEKDRATKEASRAKKAEQLATAAAESGRQSQKQIERMLAKKNAELEQLKKQRKKITDKLK